jgi:hypothetical protein
MRLSCGCCPRRPSQDHRISAHARAGECRGRGQAAGPPLAISVGRRATPAWLSRASAIGSARASYLACAATSELPAVVWGAPLPPCHFSSCLQKRITARAFRGRRSPRKSGLRPRSVPPVGAGSRRGVRDIRVACSFSSANVCLPSAPSARICRRAYAHGIDGRAVASAHTERSARPAARSVRSRPRPAGCDDGGQAATATTSVRTTVCDPNVAASLMLAVPLPRARRSVPRSRRSTFLPAPSSEGSSSLDDSSLDASSRSART